MDIQKELEPEIPQTTTGAFVTSFLSGAFSGMLSAFLTTPIDLVKTRVQTCTPDPNHPTANAATQCPTAREIARIIYKEEGFKGFMRGWLPRAVKVIQFVMLCVMVVSCCLLFLLRAFCCVGFVA
jgi:Mitochondrial carrier protein